MEISEMLEIIDAAEEYRPIIKKAVAVLKSFGPEATEIFESMVIGATDLKAKSIKRLIDMHGFSKEEAIIISCDQWSSLKQLRNINK